MASQIKTLQCWQTADGRLFTTVAQAEWHQKSLNEVATANAVLRQGGSVGAALRAVNYLGTIDPVLDAVTGSSKLVISHWQCKDTPGYQPQHFEDGMRLYVAGNVGSWSGSYGSMVTLSELVRYASDTRSILSPSESKP